MKSGRVYPARLAREAAGLTLIEAGRRARVSPAYLGQLERTGRFPYHLAQRLLRIYGGGCTLMSFLPQGGRTPDRRGGRRGTSRPRRARTGGAP
jgi:transcriptional regulator with XRE-family HTH domain